MRHIQPDAITILELKEDVEAEHTPSYVEGMDLAAFADSALSEGTVTIQPFTMLIEVNTRKLRRKDLDLIVPCCCDINSVEVLQVHPKADGTAILHHLLSINSDRVGFHKVTSGWSTNIIPSQPILINMLLTCAIPSFFFSFPATVAQVC